MGALLGPEEDDGLTASEGAAAQRDQNCLLVADAVALQQNKAGQQDLGLLCTLTAK